jgi:putative transposase
VKFAWIQKHACDFAVSSMCEVLNVSRSGYYAFLHRQPSPRQQRREALVEQIRQSHVESRGTYGSPRVWEDLQEKQIPVCRNTVALLMRESGIAVNLRKRFKVQTTDSAHGCPVAPNLLGQDFTAQAPNRRWCCDITYIPTREGDLFLAVVMDLFSRRIVGWSMADHLRATLCTDALAMALLRRKPTEGLLHHSDRGVQYACGLYRQMLADHAITCSMSRTGNCYDNAAMESFFATLKTEWVYRHDYPTRHAAAASLFEYIEVFYNRKRRHSALGYLSPEAFEAGLN